MYRIYLYESGFRQKSDYPTLFKKKGNAVTFAKGLLPLEERTDFLAVKDENTEEAVAYMDNDGRRF